MSAAALAVASAGLAGLGALYAKDARREKSRRGQALAGCRGIFEDERLAHDPAGFPVLTGRFRGHPAELRLVADTIQMRKLPILWLLVTLGRPLPVPGTLDLMVRATNADFYSPHSELPDAILLPGGWPETLSIRSDSAADMAGPLGRLELSVDRLRADDRAKEILVTPRGVRLVWRASESERGHYLLTRQPKFDFSALTAGAARSLLDWADGLCETMARPA